MRRKATISERRFFEELVILRGLYAHRGNFDKPLFISQQTGESYIADDPRDGDEFYAPYSVKRILNGAGLISNW